MQISLVNIPNQGQAASSGGSVAQERASAVSRAQDSSLVEMPVKAVKATDEVIDAQTLSDSVSKLNRAVKAIASDLQFSVDEETGIDVVKVVDTESKEVIRQIPSKEVIAIARAFDRLQGLLVREQV